MGDWWTYRPSDFLMFAPATYWRLFELHNAAWWPAPPVLSAAGLAWLAWAARGGAAAARAGAGGLALAWAFAGTAFVLGRYAQVNWAATALATLPLAAALPLGLLATRTDLRAAAAPLRRRTGLLLVAWALLAHPLLAWTSGRPLAQAEVIGLAPDPTAIATLGLLLSTDGASGATRGLRRAAWTAGAAWCAVSAATLWTMGAAQAGVPLAALAAAWAASRHGHPRRARVRHTDRGRSRRRGTMRE